MLWVKEPAHPNEQISGTVYMLNVPDDADCGTNEKEGLKQNSKGVILSPQPQNDVNDPLNWPIWRRDISLLAISVHALLVGGLTPILAPVMGTLGNEFNKKLTDLTYFVGVYMVSMGVGSVFFAPVAVVYGKRLIYLISLLILLAGLIWAANADSYGSLMGARVLSGIGAAPAESLPSTTIAEIYFAHERAYRLGIYTLLLLGGKNLSPLVSGFVANRLNWHWIFWIASIICGFVLVCSFLFVHETFWDRTPLPDKRSREESRQADIARQQRQLPPWSSDMNPGATFRSSHNSAYSSGSENHRTESIVSIHDNTHNNIAYDALTNNANDHDVHNENVQAISSNTHDFNDSHSMSKHETHDTESIISIINTIRVPFFHNLRVYTGRKTDSSIFKVFLRPFVLFCYPSVLYPTLIYSTSVVWLSVIAETINSLFTSEPYYFKQTSVGLLYVAMFVGGFLGSAVAGKISDYIVRFMCNKNNGIYEPEFRLIMIFPVMLAVSIGLMGFGWSTFDGDLWIVPAIFMGILGFGCSLASTVSITYVVDCYRVFASESLVTLNLAKNVLGLAFSIFVPYFFEASGAKTSYVVYGCVEIALCLLAIPMYRYGKVMRQYFDDLKLMKNLY